MSEVDLQREAEGLEQGQGPSWAESWGRDEFGLHAVFRVGGVEQRMRWIPAGEAWTGSPAEEGGSAYEQPPRLVLLTRGFWLADTPCTQELWQEVMGENPSRFVGPRRPVEQVSWEDVQRFCERLEQRVDGLAVGLPSELEWEHACRANTARAARYGELDDIAWYDDNAGDQTHDVGLKQPNSWGLYDMLGNVWEWCHDDGRDYDERRGDERRGDDRREAEPAVGRGPLRVFRGGGWDSPADHARAASRSWDAPDIRDDYLGFRLARGQALR